MNPIAFPIAVGFSLIFGGGGLTVVGAACRSKGCISVGCGAIGLGATIIVLVVSI
jgi:hypothetical protein